MHTAGVTTGKVHDAKVMDRLIRDDDTAVYGDKGYASAQKRRAAEAAGVLWGVKEKVKPGRKLTQRQRARNRRFGRVRAKVEHVFRVLKCQLREMPIAEPEKQPPNTASTAQNHGHRHSRRDRACYSEVP